MLKTIVNTILSATIVASASMSDDPMIAEIQALMDYHSNETGYGFTLGYIDDQGRDFGLGSGNRTQ
jgi:hypothetical protein